MILLAYVSVVRLYYNTGEIS